MYTCACVSVPKNSIPYAVYSLLFHDRNPGNLTVLCNNNLWHYYLYRALSATWGKPYLGFRVETSRRNPEILYKYTSYIYLLLLSYPCINITSDFHIICMYAMWYFFFTSFPWSPLRVIKKGVDFEYFNKWTIVYKNILRTHTNCISSTLLRDGVVRWLVLRNFFPSSFLTCITLHYISVTILTVA